MANTITFSSTMITIIPDGSTDFAITTYFPNGLRLKGVGFIGTAGDILKLRDKLITGTFIIPSLAAGDAMTFEGMLDCFPYMKAADCTFGTPANCIITLYYA